MNSNSVLEIFMIKLMNILFLSFQSGGKGKKKAQKTNLRHGPYNLQDGDVIGIKVNYIEL